MNAAEPTPCPSCGNTGGHQCLGGGAWGARRRIVDNPKSVEEALLWFIDHYDFVANAIPCRIDPEFVRAAARLLKTHADES